MSLFISLIIPKSITYLRSSLKLSYTRESPFIIALTIFLTLDSLSLSNKLSKCVSRLCIIFSFADSTCARVIFFVKSSFNIFTTISLAIAFTSHGWPPVNS
ncbi:hypothetical protein OMAG_002113 [Candidatus Omnitrophus magneticus]|uniref:Uncharacterized protein n=1 Tax=Candidatus Omnitrophus magneticus TaxID=1609969 RepID=A0A0F0CR72_9BACT|nr:hypothetical protein OMAG_002113 [Candidatus Omnitrophus magneticus]